jgi:hypothetical protein
MSAAKCELPAISHALLQKAGALRGEPLPQNVCFHFVDPLSDCLWGAPAQMVAPRGCQATDPRFPLASSAEVHREAQELLVLELLSGSIMVRMQAAVSGLQQMGSLRLGQPSGPLPPLASRGACSAALLRTANEVVLQARAESNCKLGIHRAQRIPTLTACHHHFSQCVWSGMPSPGCD